MEQRTKKSKGKPNGQLNALPFFTEAEGHLVEQPYRWPTTTKRKPQKSWEYFAQAED